MITKVAYGLNSVALIFCILITWKIFSTQAENEFLQNELKVMAAKSAEMKFAVEEAKKGQADKLNREKRKNSELEESGNAKSDEIVDLERKRDELKTSTEVAEIRGFVCFNPKKQIKHDRDGCGDKNSPGKLEETVYEYTGS